MSRGRVVFIDTSQRAGYGSAQIFLKRVLSGFCLTGRDVALID